MVSVSRVSVPAQEERRAKAREGHPEGRTGKALGKSSNGRRRRIMSQKHRTELFRAFSKWGWDQKGWSPKTRETYYQECLRAEYWLVENRQVSICWAKPKDLKMYLFQCRPTPEVRNKIRNALIGFGEFLVEQGYCEVNPARALPRLPVKQGIPKALDGASVKRVLVVARTLGYVHEALISVLLYTGIRKEEARTLEWRSFSPDIRSPEVWMRFTGKGNKERSIPLPIPAQKALAKWRIYCPDAQWVFPSPHNPGKPISGSTIQYWVNLISDSVGFHLHPHLFRHTCATILLDNGNDLRTVQEWLGHASVQTTAVYTKVRPRKLLKVRDSFDLDRYSENDEEPSETPKQRGILGE